MIFAFDIVIGGQIKKIVSWNVKGLRSPYKLMKILRHSQWVRTDVALLQETHLDAADFFRMKRLWVRQVLVLALVGRKAGVLILIQKSSMHGDK